jgi:hypothetical protein
MRVLIDEDTAVQLLEPLRHLLRRHTVDHVALINWKGADPATGVGSGQG